MMVAGSKKKKNKQKNIISFDEEIITKDVAEKILQNGIIENQPIEPEELPSIENKRKKKRNKKNKSLSGEDTVIEESINVESKQNDKIEMCPNDVPESETTVKKGKKRKQKQIELNENEEQDNQEELDPSKPEIKTKESIRARKRKRYAALLEEKKLKTELSLQEKALNYLSKWKHSRSTWKFEKLRQVWLQTNMFDASKIPEEFWGTLIEYLGNSKGKSREFLLKEAVKVIDSQENMKEEDETEEYKVKLQRARDIVQNLQE